MAQRTDAVTIAPVEPTDETAMRAWFDMAVPAHAHDLPGDPLPTWNLFRTRLSVPPAGIALSGWFAHAGDSLAGAAVLHLPQRDNLDNAYVDLLVAPAFRRSGIGRRLLEHLAEQARAHGRKRLILEAFQPADGPSPGTHFLDAVGARVGLLEQRHRLDLGALDHATLAGHAAQARHAADGYDVVQWTGVTPEHLVDDMAVLWTAMSTDAPLDDLSLAPEVWDADRVRAADAVRDARGMLRSVAAAVGPDGHLAGFTVIVMRAAEDTVAAQGATLVRTEHRGHRLGMLIKLANLESLRTLFPDVQAVQTYTADSNPYMRSINTALGFRPYDRIGQWELDL